MPLKAVFVVVLAILTAVILPLHSFSSGQETVTPLREWSGSVDDTTLLKSAPEFILSAREFESLWVSWKLPGPPPEVDFSSNLVAVQTTQGSKLRLSASLDDRGNLTVVGLATRDLHPGFRYVLAVLSRKGVQTFNGKALSGSADQGHVETGSVQDRADFAVSAGDEVYTVKSLELDKVNDEIIQALSKGEAWPKEVVLVAIKFVGAGLKGSTKIIEVRTPPESQDPATVTVTESGYLDDAIAGERWRLWLTKKADGVWIVDRALWAQLCGRPGRSFYSAGKCP